MNKNYDDMLVIIKTFDSINEANIVKGLLKSFNIDCFILHANAAEIFPGTPGMLSQIQLLARKEDQARIKGIMEAKFDPI